MKKQAIWKAGDRLARSKLAIEDCRHAGISMAFKDSWSDFLLAHNSFFSMLQQGAKGCPISIGWFDGIKQTRLSDPLLSYFYAARNADEHDIVSVIQVMQTTSYVAAEGHEVEVLRIADTGQPSDFQISSTAPITVTVDPLRWSLAPIKEKRSGKVVPVPSTHLGQPLPCEKEVDPVVVATLALAWLDQTYNQGLQLPARE